MSRTARPTSQSGPGDSPSLPPLAGGVLVGGASRRMGRPKQLIEIDGLTLAERAAAALAPFVSRVVLLGDGPVAPPLSHLERFADAPGVKGPLAGLLSALRSSPRSAFVIAACDLPALSADAVRWLVAQRRDGVCAVLPRQADGTAEPLLAVYEPEALELLEGLARGDRPAPSLLAGRAGVISPVVPREIALAWHNANRPEDMAT